MYYPAGFRSGEQRYGIGSEETEIKKAVTENPSLKKRNQFVIYFICYM